MTFVDYRNKLFLHEDVRMRKYEMSGNSYGLWFVLIFTTEELSLKILTMELRLQSNVHNHIREFADRY